MDAAECVEKFGTIVPVLPSKESHVRELLKLEAKTLSSPSTAIDASNQVDGQDVTRTALRSLDAILEGRFSAWSA